MLHPLARLRAASLVLLATLTPLALGNTEILVSRLPFELADLPKAAHSASVLERAMGLEMRTVRLSWPASHPTTFHLSTHRAPSSSPDPSLPHLLISATPSFVSPSCDQTLYVPFTILLEPIHFGGVPESTLPFVLVLVGLVGVMGVSGVAGGMGRWLEELAEADWKLGRAGEDEKAD
uniref:FGENESH: predicted gene_1.195 protein n=1 Tax=Rhodotorula toruloides TaxID=5286 RepID=A0A0K3C448_RHOTO